MVAIEEKRPGAEIGRTGIYSFHFQGISGRTKQGVNKKQERQEGLRAGQMKKKARELTQKRWKLQRIEGKSTITISSRLRIRRKSSYRPSGAHYDWKK